MKKILVMIICLLVINNALAVDEISCPSESPAGATCWTCGGNCTAIYTDGILSINGTGQMKDYTASNLGNNHFLTHAPWSAYVNDIAHVSVQGVSSIGESSFLGLKNMEDIDIGNSVKSIGAISIDDCEKLTKIILPPQVSSIGGWAFFNNPNVTEIIVSSSTPLSSDRYAYSPDILTYQEKNKLIYVYDKDKNLVGVYENYDNFISNMYKEISERDTFTQDENGHVTLYGNSGKILGKYDNAGHLLIQYDYDLDGSYVAYDQNGKIVDIRGKRIFTVEEATALVQNNKNTFTLKYR